MFWHNPQPQILALGDIDTDAIPVLNARELVQLLGLDNRLRQIKRLASASDQHFSQLFLSAIDRYLEAAQLQPASMSDHHAGLGGLAIHTLEVVENAMRRRKGYLLPQHADPSQIRAEEQIWTFAIFAAALLHDAGKMLSLTRLDIDADLDWTPHGPSLSDLNIEHYKIRFVRAPYSLQQTVNNTLFHLLPAEGRGWLAQNDMAMAQLTAYLFGNVYEMGVLGEIVRQADGESVAANRKSGGERERLSHAPTIPLVERLMRVLRQLIDEGDIQFNRSGAAGWIDNEGYCYLVCGVVATKVAERLRLEGSTDIPGDNTRLFDIWQDHAYIEPDPSGRAIWHMRVKGEGFEHKLTMLKFDSYKVLHPSRRLKPFSGELLPCSAQDTETQPEDLATNSSACDSSPGKSTAEHAAAMTDINNNLSDAMSASDASSTDAGQRMPNEAVDSVTATAAADVENVTKNANVARVKVSGKPGEGQHFLNWVRASLASGEQKINTTESRIHVIKEGVVLISPALFKDYLRIFRLCKPAEEDEHYRKMQVKVQKLKQHLLDHRDKNVHVFKVVGENRTSKVFGWLFPVPLFFEDSPAINPHLSLTNGVQK
ncbi:MAG: MobH family relaxase [Gammaproteobacteria bacterium]